MVIIPTKGKSALELLWEVMTIFYYFDIKGGKKESSLPMSRGMRYFCS